MTMAHMKVWNVELGLAVHVQAPNGKYVVIDLGASDNVEPLTYLYGKDVYYMVITHPHKDHFDDILNIDNGLPTILNYCHAFTRDELLKDVPEAYFDKFEHYCNFVEKYNQNITSTQSPATGIPLGGMKVRVFSTTECDKSNINNFSSIVVLELNDSKVVVCGDPEIPALQKLIEKKDFCDAIRDAEVLVAPHHGRESAYLCDFVNLVNPKITIVSDTKKKDVSASDKYGLNSKGFFVYNKNNLKFEKRFCLTTRCDGNIYVDFGGELAIAIEG